MNIDYQQYLIRMEKIRRLSSPELTAFDQFEDYAHRLNVNFRAIGKFSEKNRLFLNKKLYPLLASTEPLTDEQFDELTELCTSLMSAVDCENLDLPVASLLSKRLMYDARNSSDLSCLIQQLDMEIGICYSLMNMTSRITSHPEISEHYRQRGHKAGELFLSLLEPSVFSSISSAASRELVLTNARYSVVFFEGIKEDALENQRNLDILEQMLKLANDSFYQGLVPGFDWDYFLYKVLEYYAFTTDYCNRRQFSPSQLEQICKRTKALRSLWYSDQERFREIASGRRIELLYARNQFLAGQISEYDYRNRLLSLFRKRNSQNYDVDGLYENLLVPLEYICLLNPNKLTSKDKFVLNMFYQDITAYMFQMQNVGSMSFMLEFFFQIIEHFIEVPSGITFENMVLQCLAALHPPTYVHSMTVGQLTECLCGHLLEKNPELLIGVCGCQSREEVIAHREEILSFSYHAAICHDFGKIPIIDTIFVYGRKLLDMEFDIIKQHPAMGYEMLLRHESTRAYAEVARGHHKWYDNSNGYPEDFHATESSVNPIINLVLCVDCLDAATDSIGRSYSKAKTLKNFLEELREGAGTRYAPWLVTLLSDDGVYQDIKYLLIEGKRQIYRNIFLLLKDVQEKGK